MENIIFRELCKNDWNKGYFDLLKQLSTSSPMGEDEFKNILDIINKSATIYIFEDTSTSKIVGTATLMIEQKFIRGGGKVGHLEDVVIDKNYRGINLGIKIIEKIVNLAREKGCYKIIGNCDEKLLVFYEKNGFSKKGVQIAIYF